MPTVVSLIARGSDVGGKNDSTCVECKKTPINAFKTVSRILGEIVLYPRICDDCKILAYQNHQTVERREAYFAQTGRCGGNQNQKIWHINNQPHLHSVQRVLPWQEELLRYIKLTLAGKSDGSLLVQGGVGVGKTYLTKILHNELVDRLMPTAFIKATDLSIFIKKLTFKDDYRAIMRDFKNVETLIIDDFGVHKATDVVKEIIFSIIDARYENRRRTIITTNLDKDSLEKMDPRLSSRLFDKKWMQACRVYSFDMRENTEDIPF
nr:MAG: replicative helicase [Podoviridae sp. ctka020]